MFCEVLGPTKSLSAFRLSSEEWYDLDRKFGKLCRFQAKLLLDKNIRGGHTEDFDDIEQEMRQSMMVAALYTKRQRHIENCFKIAAMVDLDPETRAAVNELLHLWENKRKHGASRQKFGPPQEAALQKIIDKNVPKRLRPNPDTPLVLDEQFARYCKQITWNRCKTMGKKITKERTIRTGLVSLSQFDFLSGTHDL